MLRKDQVAFARQFWRGNTIITEARSDGKLNWIVCFVFSSPYFLHVDRLSDLQHIYARCKKLKHNELIDRNILDLTLQNQKKGMFLLCGILATCRSSYDGWFWYNYHGYPRRPSSFCDHCSSILSPSNVHWKKPCQKAQM